MRNLTGVRSDELQVVLRDAARMQAHSLPGALVYDEGDAASARVVSKMNSSIGRGRPRAIVSAHGGDVGCTNTTARRRFSWQAHLRIQ